MRTVAQNEKWTPVTNFRIPVKLREDVRRVAASRGQTLTQAVIEAMTWYVKKYDR